LNSGRVGATNLGGWMAHCHIAENHESGMMFGFDVAPRKEWIECVVPPGWDLCAHNMSRTAYCHDLQLG
jgi:hypothetical protein